MKNRMYCVIRPLNVKTSTLRKSVAATHSQCAFRNVDHRVCASRSGAGSIPFFFQNVGGCATSDFMSQISQCPLDARVPPRWILERHAHNEIGDRVHDARPTWTAPVTVIPLGGNEFSIPSQERVWSD
jgi:hypothetical protein